MSLTACSKSSDIPIESSSLLLLMPRAWQTSSRTFLKHWKVTEKCYMQSV